MIKFKNILNNKRSKDKKKEKQHFYGENVWAYMAEKYKDSILDGISCYGEIVGFTKNGSGIQSSKGIVYDYGCAVNTCDFYVFRITYTSPSGDVYEFSMQQIQEYCSKYGLNCIPIFYIGRAKDKYPELKDDENWHEGFLNKLSEEFLEKDNSFCRNRGLPDEGIILSKRVGKFIGLKLKSLRFLEDETKQLDKEQVNIEDE